MQSLRKKTRSEKSMLENSPKEKKHFAREIPKTKPVTQKASTRQKEKQPKQTAAKSKKEIWFAS